MSVFDDIIRKRRSIRQYDGMRSISREEILELISAANEAPSWKNKQTARYHFVLRGDRMDRLKCWLHPQNQQAMANAAALVVCTFKKNIVGFERDGSPTNELGNGWGIYNLGLHNAFFVLKATDMGIDSVILGLRDAEGLRKELNISEEEIVVSVIGLGYRTIDSQRPTRKCAEDISTFYD